MNHALLRGFVDGGLLTGAFWLLRSGHPVMASYLLALFAGAAWLWFRKEPSV
jgi:hypothetical protein